MAIRVACVQCNVVYGGFEKNAERMVTYLTKLKRRRVDLAIFPEAFLTGYCVKDEEEAKRVAIFGVRGRPEQWQEPAARKALAGDILFHLAAACDAIGIHAVAGFAEYTDDGKLYNSAALLAPGKMPRVYRKVHLPLLGLDRHVEPGNELFVWETSLGKIGVLICFDMRFPEAARTLALKGAELIVLPTNWPEGAEVSAGHGAIIRAAENRVFFAACNRVGDENGFHFIGQSKIVDPTGKVLASAGDKESILVADLELSMARDKRSIMIPGVYEVDVFGPRRPELYGPITEPRR